VGGNGCGGSKKSKCTGRGYGERVIVAMGYQEKRNLAAKRQGGGSWTWGDSDDQQNNKMVSHSKKGKRMQGTAGKNPTPDIDRRWVRSVAILVGRESYRRKLATMGGRRKKHTCKEKKLGRKGEEYSNLTRLERKTNCSWKKKKKQQETKRKT